MNHRPRSPSNTEPRRRRAAGRTGLVVVLACALAGGLGSAAGATHAWLVAGEPDARSPDNRSAATTLWLAETLRGLPGGSSTQTFTADPTPEVIETRPGGKATDGQAALQPLARVFGQQAFNAVSGRRFRIGSTLAGARADTLSAALDKDFATLGTADRGLLVYTGPGLSDAADSAGNTLRLWDNTGLSVRELDALASHVPANTPMRFVLSQCHSSGFQRLIRPSARDLRSLGRHNRCAFTAEPVDHLGTGQRCPAGGADPGSGDYTTQLFSALTGRTRTGSPLLRSADLDGNRVVSLHEAHLYAVIEGDSAELPRASTETYLERWQPVWLRYVDTVTEPDNEYGRVSMALAERLRLPLRGRALVDALETRQKEMTGRLHRLVEESQRVGAEIDRLQATLRRALTQRWPAAAHPHTAAYAQFLANDVGVAQNFLLGQTATYPVLVAKQDRLVRIAQEQQTLDRSLTQLDKLMRLRQLARLQAQFDRHASAQAQQEYARLTRCERLPL